MELTVKTDDLLKWARHFEQLPQRTKPAIANALNAIGAGVVAEAVDHIHRTTGLAPDVIRDLLHVHEATPRRLTWTMDASEIAPPSLDWSRPWDRGQADSAVDKQRLVKVVTMDDEKVCPICEEAAENGPYTIEEAQRMLPLHPNCRCMMQAWQSLRRLPVVFGQGENAIPEFLTVKQLARKVSDAVSVEITNG